MARKYNRITPGRKVRQIKGRKRLKPPANYTGRKPNARKDNAAPLKSLHQIAHQRNRVILTEQRRIAKPSSRFHPPAQHMIGSKPAEEQEYDLYSKNGYIGRCTVVSVRTARISHRGMTRYKVAVDGREVGMAAKVGNHMKLLHR